jgi:hypothetical protein
MRTYSRESFIEANDLWADGRFSDEWKPWRHRAAMRGFIYPPAGTAYDSWGDDEPSQRAVIVRAIRETPKLLERAIDRSRSWGEVYAYLIKHLNEDRDLIEAADRETARRKAAEHPDQREAMSSIGSMFDRIAQSLGYVRR